ncbi:hypothetical protein ACWJH8_00375, partial [Actinotignum schaalii]
VRFPVVDSPETPGTLGAAVATGIGVTGSGSPTATLEHPPKPRTATAPIMASTCPALYRKIYLRYVRSTYAIAD